MWNYDRNIKLQNQWKTTCRKSKTVLHFQAIFTTQRHIFKSCFIRFYKAYGILPFGHSSVKMIIIVLLVLLKKFTTFSTQFDFTSDRMSLNLSVFKNSDKSSWRMYILRLMYSDSIYSLIPLPTPFKGLCPTKVEHIFL